MREWFKARNLWGAAISALSDEEAGRLAKAIWAYTMNGKVVDIEGAGKGIYALILMTLEQDKAHDEEVSKKRSIAGSTTSQTNDKANASKTEQTQSNDIKTNQMISNDDNKNKNKNKNKDNKNENKEIQERFERFYSVYPRHESKQAALKEFEKLKPDEELLTAMIEAVEKQKQSPQWKESNGQYIPHPSTWIHNKRWEDEVKQQNPIRAVTAQNYTQRDYSGEQEAAFNRMLEEIKGEGA